jgi:hypothetical protein
MRGDGDEDSNSVNDYAVACSDYGEDCAHDKDRNDDDQKNLMTMIKLKRSIIM